MAKATNNGRDSKAKNVVWVIVDSVRNYYTDADDRGRIALIDELAKNGVEFKTAVTSAPSTVMSTSAMFTGVPSIFHSRTYNDFDFDSEQFRSLPLLLEREGYHLYNIVVFPEPRDFLEPMLGNLCRPQWPTAAKPTEIWSNDLINEILSNLLKDEVEAPFFLYLNYNCRHDPQTSEKVKLGLSKLKESGLLEDCVFILNSDHGYPDPSRKISFYKRRKFGHDLIMTDDNILTPLVFKYPGCPARSIDSPVSLLDIAPTILELIGYPELFQVRGYPSFGRSLVPLIEGTEKDYNPTVRTDNRYLFQDRRISALRTSDHKYVFSFDDGVEEFYDLNQDPGEVRNLATDAAYGEKKQAFFDELMDQETKIYEFHREKLKLSAAKFIHKSDRQWMLLGRLHSNFIRMMADLLSDFGVEQLWVQSAEIKEFSEKFHCRVRVIEDWKEISLVDLVLGVLADKDPKQHYQVQKDLKRSRSQRKHFVNYNLRVQAKPQHWILPAANRFVRKKLPLLKSDPKAFFTDVRLMAKWVVSSNRA